MAFSARDLHTLIAGDSGTTLWTYRTTDPLGEVSRNDYWREASATVCEGDIIFATSGATKPLQGAQFLVADAFGPCGRIVLTRLAHANA
jgi:hypothetical protein